MSRQIRWGSQLVVIESTTSVAVQFLQGLRVCVDDVEVILQPSHLALVPRGLQLAQAGNLVDQLLLLADPQRPGEKEVWY